MDDIPPRAFECKEFEDENPIQTRNDWLEKNGSTDLFDYSSLRYDILNLLMAHLPDETSIEELKAKADYIVEIIDGSIPVI